MADDILTGTRVDITPMQLVQRHAMDTSFHEDEHTSVEEDEYESEHNPNHHQHSLQLHPEQKPEGDLHDTFVAKEAARTANCAGYCVLLSLLLLGGILATVSYFFVTGVEQDDFESEFAAVSTEVMTGVQQNADALYAQLQQLARLYSAHADSSAVAETSPALTLLEWEAFGSTVRSAFDVAVIVYAPWLLTPLQRDEWGLYSQQHAESWISHSYQLLQWDAATTLPAVRHDIWRYSDSGSVEKEGGPAPYSPGWQWSPPPPPAGSGDNNRINFNLNAHGIYEHLANLTAQSMNRAFLSQPFDLSTLYGGAMMKESDIPHSLAIVPVAKGVFGQNESAMVTGHISAALPWTTLFTNVLQDHQNGITAVVDSCNGAVVNTFQIDGKQSTFLGPNDLHDPSFNEQAHSGFFYGLLNSSQAAVELDGLIYCRHKITTYPTGPYQEAFQSRNPITYAVTVGVVIFFAICLFLSYDCIVRRQQSKVLGEAERSNAIVASLFPGKVARRLFLDTSRHSAGGGGVSGVLDMSEGRSTHSVNILNFMNKSEVKIAEASRPIAELFPEATVMFADIAGFTAWSSIREPSQVFMLLESIFQAFDGIAKSFGVFKVETVGDCYVACCGVPEPNEDHATVMAQFARECLRKFHIVVHDLELKLGPDTSDLSMRFGLNSGPVTAGVLRGERARFQLFGDTVNTAARMESTGARGKIHLSDHTANILIAQGRASWVKPRQDKVQAKGKGTMSTYWLQEEIAAPRLWQEERPSQHNLAGAGAMAPNHIVAAAPGVIATNEDDGIDFNRMAKSSGHSSVADTGNGPSSASDAKAAEGMIGVGPTMEQAPMANTIPAASSDRKTQRLIDWNTELLMQLLKQVVARRYAVAGRRTMPDALWEMARNVGEGHMPVEEVLEIIVLPDFDERAVRQVDPETVILSPEVTTQCRSYVAILASMYRKNPFHNFEHASHVTMSVSKLLSRIVAPEIDREKLHDVMDQEHLMHDHTYGITSDPLTQFSVVLSALIHDVDHRGVPNFLLVKEDENLAAAYDSKSVAEQNSVDLAWNALMRPEFGELRSCIFSDLTELRRFRALLVNSVIATDIFDKELGTLRKNRWAKAFAESISETNRQNVNRKATIVIEHLIQASDVAHTMQHWHVYQKWNERLFEEMYGGYLEGRNEKDPSPGWYKGELGFFDNYIIPLAKKLKECGVFGVASDEYLNYAMENRREWAGKGHDVVARMIKKFNKSGDHNDSSSSLPTAAASIMSKNA